MIPFEDIVKDLSSKKGKPVTVTIQGTKFIATCPSPDHEDKHPSCIGDMGTGAYKCSCGCEGTINEAAVNNPKKVTIKICGFAGSGKTSVAVVIEKALRDAGFNVGLFEAKDGDAETKRIWLATGALKEVFPGIEVEITEVNTHRRGL